MLDLLTSKDHVLAPRITKSKSWSATSDIELVDGDMSWLFRLPWGYKCSRVAKLRVRWIAPYVELLCGEL